jgi:hypothetical protein
MADELGSLTGVLAIDDQLSGVLDAASQKVGEFADMFDGAMGVVIGAAGAAAAAVAGLTTAVVELAEKGSTVSGVEDAFNTLALQVGTTGEALRTSFSSGLAGTVDQLTIMKDTTRLLGSGMQLTTDQANTMGEAARALGKATGTDAAQGLEMMSSALTTGRTRQLQMQIGLIDTKKGEEEFAASIGTTADQLNTEGQLEGKRLAIFEAVDGYLKRVGDSELTFKERIEQSKTAISDWVDELAVMISKSDGVNGALIALQTQLKDAFGADTRSAMLQIVAAVNNLASVFVTLSPVIGFVGKALKDIFISQPFQQLQMVIDDWRVLKLELQGYTQASAEAEVAQLRLNAALHAQAKDVNLPSDQPTGPKAVDPSKYIKDQGNKAEAATQASLDRTQQLWEQYYQATDKMAGESLQAKLDADERWYEAEEDKLAKTAKLNGNYEEEDYAISQLYLTKKAADEATFNQKQVDVLQKLHDQTVAAEAKTADDALTAKLQGIDAATQAEELSYQKQYDDGTISADTLEKAVAEIQAKGRAERLSAEQAQADKVSAIVLAGFNQIQGAQKNYNDFVATQTQTSTTLQEQKIQEWADAQKKAFKGTEDERKAFDAIIEADAQAQTDALTIDNKALVDNSRQALQDIADKNYDTWQAMTADPSNYSATTIEKFHQIYLKSQEAADGVQQSWTDTFDNITKAIPNIIQQAFTGSGGGLGAVQAVGSLIGSEVGKKLTSSLRDTLSSLSESGSSFLSGISDLISGAIPVIGAAIGPLLGSVFNSLFGTQGRDAVVAFAQTFGGFDQLHAKLDAVGAAGEQMWVKLTQQTGRNDLAAAQATIADINKLLQQQQTDTQNVAAAMQKYGLTWEMAGGQAEQSHLDTIAQGLVKDFADLYNAGFGVDVITQHMSSSIDDYIHEAERTGSEVPSAMEPLLQHMIDLGTLTDNNGNKITDMSQLGVTFAETMTQGFQSIVDAVNTLTKALTGSDPSSLVNSLNAVGNVKVHPTIQPVYDPSQIPPGAPGGGGGPGSSNPNIVGGPGGSSALSAPTTSATLPGPSGMTSSAGPHGGSNMVTVPIVMAIGNEVVAKQMIKTFVRAGFGT